MNEILKWSGADENETHIRGSPKKSDIDANQIMQIKRDNRSISKERISKEGK